MRFDLEFNIVEQLTQEGLALLADTFYNTDKSAPNVIAPAKWDNASPLPRLSINKGDIDLSKLKKLNLPSWLYASGVAGEYDISVDKMIIRNNLICPIFNAGGIFSYKDRYEWSNHVITKLCSIKDSSYYCDIDPDTDIDTIQVYTLKLEYPGFLVRAKEYGYIEYDGVSLESTFNVVDRESLFTVIENRIYLNGQIITYNEIEIGLAHSGKNSLMSLPQFPILRDENEEPIITLSSQILPENFRILTSIVMVQNKSDQDIKVLASYSATPIVTYKQTSRLESTDKVWKNISLTPSAISFKDGLVCLYNILGTAGGTIRTCDGATILMPTNLNIKLNKPTLGVLDSTKITALLTGVDNIPVKGANIRFEITSVGGDAVFMESNTYSVKARTGLDGQVDVNAIINSMKFGWYIQKEWVVNNSTTGKYQIRIPYKLSTDKPEDIYLYFVTADDPILGKKYAQEYLKYKLVDQGQRLREGTVEQPLEEYYTQPGNLGSYTINGRKIAWIRMRTVLDDVSRQANKLQTHYVKPSAISYKQLHTKIRDLYIKSTSTTIANDINNMGFLSIGTSYEVPVYGYMQGVLPGNPNKMKILRAEVSEGTVIEYSEPIPDNDNIVGYWLVTGTSGDIRVRAYFEDECNLIYLESQEIKIKIVNYIKSESEFILSGTELEKYNTALNSFGYYTPSEYLDNPFHINSCTYACRWGDPIQRRCMHLNMSVAAKYLEDPNNGMCLHTAEFDINLPWEEACPIVNKYMPDGDGSTTENPKYEADAVAFVNPFVLHIEKP